MVIHAPTVTAQAVFSQSRVVGVAAAVIHAPSVIGSTFIHPKPPLSVGCTSTTTYVTVTSTTTRVGFYE
jgi:hypothetical protein